jgi:RNA polymerase sigma factor (sigma-70 family)
VRADSYELRLAPRSTYQYWMMSALDRANVTRWLRCASQTATETRRAPDLVALDDALDLLAKQDERKARVVELRYFAGLNNEEIASALEISTDTVTRDWNMAKLWLRRELRKERR